MLTALRLPVEAPLPAAQAVWRLGRAQVCQPQLEADRPSRHAVFAKLAVQSVLTQA